MGFWGSLWEGIKSVGKKVWDGVSHVGKKVYEGVKTVGKFVKPAVGWIKDNIVDNPLVRTAISFIPGGVGKIASVGANLISGLGQKSGSQLLGRTAETVADRLRNLRSGIQ